MKHNETFIRCHWFFMLCIFATGDHLNQGNHHRYPIQALKRHYQSAASFDGPK